MKNSFFLFFLFFAFTCFSQNEKQVKSDTIKRKSLIIDHSKDKPKARYDQYRIVTLEHDTTYVDTSLTIKKLYKYNYLRKDIFGLLPFANEGQTYNTLYYGLNEVSSFPEFGFKAKSFDFVEANKVNYYSVATPLTELYFKTVMEQGQNLDALVTLNLSERLNISISYKGLRSLGKYINQLSSTGNFAFTTTYSTKSNRYSFNTHYTGQDILNGENGGITTMSDFNSGDIDFKNRARLNVFLTDATSFLKGKRFFLNHAFRLNSDKSENNFYINHQINYENKFFEFDQTTVPSTIDGVKYNLFGVSYVTGNLKDQTHYNKLYNKIGAVYENETLGKFQFFWDDFRDNMYYQKVLFLNTGVVPSFISDKINTVGGQYDYRKNKWTGTFLYNKAISRQTLSNTIASLNYKIDDKNQIDFQLQNTSKLPNDTYRLFQSTYTHYNWYNNFLNEKNTTLKVNAKTKWLDASFQYTNIKDHLYFSNDSVSINRQIISPKQYLSDINYASIKIAREFKFRKWALDNTLLFQEVKQGDKILNLPQIVTRNSLYFSDYYFKKALFLQTGITLNYFSKYYGDSYNPLVGEFFIQKEQKIGGYPNLDFFVNGRIRQTRIFIIAEHFNSGFSGYNYYAAPNYPYRDFIIRFGLVWNFFQ